MLIYEKEIRQEVRPLLFYFAEESDSVTIFLDLLKKIRSESQ